MNRSQFFSIIGIILLITGCFLPWMRIEEPALTISGVDTTGTRYGKPGYVHFMLSILIIACTFIPKVWAKRFNLLFAALNLAWASRNFGVIPACDGGICPQKLLGLYFILIGSIIIMITVLFPKEPKVKQEAQTGI